MHIVALVASLAALIGMLGAVPAGDGLLPASSEPYYAQIDAIVAKRGWACVYVQNDATKKTGWGYTVGLSAKHLPELIVDVEDDSSTTCGMLTAVAKKLIARGSTVDDGYEPLGPKRVRLNKIFTKEFLERCPLAGVWAIRHDTLNDRFIGMQIVLPDERGRYPD